MKSTSKFKSYSNFVMTKTQQSGRGGICNDDLDYFNVLTPQAVKAL
jgi:hypothetical protein